MLVHTVDDDVSFRTRLRASISALTQTGIQIPLSGQNECYNVASGAASGDANR
ncbi:hypothetical protein ACVILL_001887 [Bradyrhizobium sp. USDA 3364]